MEIVQHKHITWIDFKNPDEDDILYLQENFNIHPLAIEEFATPTYLPRATRYTNCLFLSVHVPLFDTEKRATYSGEIDVIVTPTHIITGHRKSIYQIEDFIKGLQESEGKRRLFMNKTPSHLLYEILRILLDSCFPRLEHVSHNIDAIEESVFNGEERQMVREISVIKRDVLNFRRAIMPQRTILESITGQPGNIIAPDIKAYFHDLIGTNIRLWNMLESALETIKSLEETNNSLLSQKINTKMRILTTFSVLVIPMTLYANVLGINVPTPLADNEFGFVIHLGIMLGVSLFTLVFFRLVKWL